MDKKATKIIKFLDVFVIAVILAIVIWASIQTNMIPFLAPILLILMGLAFICSKKLKEFSFVERVFYWISYNVFVPRSEYSYIIWGVVFIILGLSSKFFLLVRKDVAHEELITGDSLVQDYQSWWYKDPMLWVVIILLIFIVLYRSKSRKP